MTVEAPWDDSPPSEAKLSYFARLYEAVGKGNPAARDTTMVSEAINGLNKARKALGIPFEEFTEEVVA